jgi:hypothetical protein
MSSIPSNLYLLYNPYHLPLSSTVSSTLSLTHTQLLFFPPTALLLFFTPTALLLFFTPTALLLFFTPTALLFFFLPTALHCTPLHCRCVKGVKEQWKAIVNKWDKVRRGQQTYRGKYALHTCLYRTVRSCLFYSFSTALFYLSFFYPLSTFYLFDSILTFYFYHYLSSDLSGGAASNRAAAPSQSLSSEPTYTTANTNDPNIQNYSYMTG